MRNNCKDTIRKAIQESWTDFCTDNEKETDVAILDKLLSPNPEATLSALKLPKGAYSGSDEETSACLIRSHFLVFKKSGKGGGETLKGHQRPLVTQVVESLVDRYILFCCPYYGAR